MNIICPHCQSSIGHVEEGANEITCPSCSKSFSLAKSQATCSRQ